MSKPKRERDWLEPPPKPLPAARYFVFDPVSKELVELPYLRGWRP